MLLFSYRSYWSKRYENDARGSNWSQKTWSHKEVHKVLDLIKPYNPTLETIETIKGVEKKFDDLYDSIDLAQVNLHF